MPTISIMWQIKDNAACPICKDINGHTWVYDVSGPPIPDSLIHPKHGKVWDKFIGSNAHGHEAYHCRCSLIPKIDVRDLQAKVKLMLDMTKEGAEFSLFTRYGKPTGAWRDVSTGRFVAQT